MLEYLFEHIKQWIKYILKQNKKRVGARSLKIKFKDVFVLEYKEKSF